LKSRYSINDVEKLSGIKAHTLRIWEKRYNLITPKRTTSNIRFYDEADLKQLMGISLLYHKGYKISKIACMEKRTLRAKILGYRSADLTFEAQLDSMMRYIVAHDAEHLNLLIDQYIDKVGLEQTMNQLIFPLLDKLNLAWIAGSFTLEHQVFVSKLIKKKILAGITLHDEKEAKAHCLIYLSPDQKQELSLLLFHYLLKKNNFEVSNLGTQVNLSELCSAEACQPELIFTILNKKNLKIPLQQYLDELTHTFPSTNILILGHQTVAPDIKWPKRVIRFYKLSDAVDYIKAY